MLLNEPLTNYFRLTVGQKAGLSKLRLNTARDLLFHLPAHYGIAATEKNIALLITGEQVSIHGLVTKSQMTKAWRRRIPMAEIVISDGTGQIKALWFHQAYLAKVATIGATVRLTGKVAESRAGEKYLANPTLELTTGLPEAPATLFNPNSPPDPHLQPIYPETRGLSSLWLTHAIRRLMTEIDLEQVTDPLPIEILRRYHLPSLNTALIWIHQPKRESDARAARKRFSFQEIFFIQLERQRAKLQYQTNHAHRLAIAQEPINEFIKNFPFNLTAGQNQAIHQILEDLRSDQPMLRLLEGDVGSGKTAVAATAAYAAIATGWSVAYMAPTEILARQHFQSFMNYFGPSGINLGLVTSGEARKFPSKINPRDSTHVPKTQLLKWVADGTIPLVVGTHSLLAEAVKFKRLALVIIDEQHRFGVKQRAKLVNKPSAAAPHLLSMTATPIPRTLALTIYGDLDLSVLAESPPGRRRAITTIVAEAERPAVYQNIKLELAAGRQAYVICPRIDENDGDNKLELKSAKSELRRLQTKIFPDFRLGLIHGRLTLKNKDEVMANFTAGEIDILVSTSVVEVGVDVPNATIIIIEGAERFGLAQLHQLRGRVERSQHQAYCYLFSERLSGKSLARLRALEKAASGFALAELDLKLRGSGSLSGAKQWGLSDIGMEAIQNLRMVEAAQKEARALLAADPELRSCPLLAAEVNNNQTTQHWE